MSLRERLEELAASDNPVFRRHAEHRLAGKVADPAPPALPPRAEGDTIVTCLYLDGARCAAGLGAGGGEVWPGWCRSCLESIRPSERVTEELT